MLDKNIPYDIDDQFHGTAVSSLIVDGPQINPDLEDGCGRFKVRHFGVATQGKNSSFAIIRAIREIIVRNTDIKVWNLSLGSALEIQQNFISPEAAELDRIQAEYDVVFVVAGTNKPKGIERSMKIGAPADSLNSVVVNAVDTAQMPVSYHRIGPVLSFFQKPDVSCFGGDKNKFMRVCGPLGEAWALGTSYAAPWITRKMAFLINKMGLSREVAKALLIDSASQWKPIDSSVISIGYGIVPTHIDEIVKTRNDEIRFIMTGTTEEYETYTYDIPIPTYLDAHPFFARATLCYFPKCSRRQGVDYTNTEMDIHFGRVQETEKGGKIHSIDSNRQGDEGFASIFEEAARENFRKWDNVKHISDTISPRARPRKKYSSGLWGIKIVTKERLSSKRDRAMPFGIVVTLREMRGVNRIDEFIERCSLRGWLVTKVNIDSRFEIYTQAEEELLFE